MGILGALIVVFLWGCIWAFATAKVIENKGYEENWFWWGFFFGFLAFIAALAKPDVDHTAFSEPQTPGKNLTPRKRK